MTKEDRKEVIEIVTESMKIISSEIRTDLKDAIELQTKNFKSAFGEQTKNFKSALKEQTNIFLKVLEAYEKRADKHEKNFLNIKKSIE